MSDAAAQRRARQTVINLGLSLAATLGIVLALVLIVPRDDSNRIQPVDYKDIAAGAVETTSLPLIVPELPSTGWWSNSAQIKTSPTDGTDASWTAGFVGPNNEFIGFTQAFTTNPTWIAEKTKNYLAIGEATPVGREVGLQKYTGQTEKTKGQELWLFTLAPMTPKAVSSVVIISGTGDQKEFALFADLLGFGLN